MNNKELRARTVNGFKTPEALAIAMLTSRPRPKPTHAFALGLRAHFIRKS